MTAFELRQLAKDVRENGWGDTNKEKSAKMDKAVEASGELYFAGKVTMQELLEPQVADNSKGFALFCEMLADRMETI